MYEDTHPFKCPGCKTRFATGPALQGHLEASAVCGSESFWLLLTNNLLGVMYNGPAPVTGTLEEIA